MPMLSRAIKAAAIASLVSAPLAIRANITLNIDAGTLYGDSTGTAAAPNSTLVILAADTQGNGFQGPTASQFVTGDDVELYRWTLGGTLGAGYTQPTSLLLSTAQIQSFSGLSTGDPLRLYWFPTLTQSASSPGAGTIYGTYNNPSTVNGSIPWTFPNDGGTYALNFFTPSVQGTSPLPESDGYASLTVVPEPQTYGLIAGAGCLAFGVAARRLRANKKS